MPLPEKYSALENISTPSYVVDIDALEKNLKTLKALEEASGCLVLLALKGFSCYAVFDIVKKYLRGTTSSGVNEARLAREFFGGEIHVYNPAFLKTEIGELAQYANTIVFNSQNQLDKFAGFAREAAEKFGNKNLEIGLRVNPQYAEVETEIYNPCAEGSRLGATRSSLRDGFWEKIEMLHFHAMCEQNSDVLQRIVPHFERNFGDVIPKVRALNFGGGHHVTKEGYDFDLLVKIVSEFYKKYPNIEKIYIEPGEAVALNAGVFATRVLEVASNSRNIAILDCSAPCHMPDVLEMPYRPPVFGGGLPNEKKYSYELAGRSCLAGDRIGTYSFDSPLREGDIVLFGDMAHYTMVKTTTFNGVNLPDIATFSPSKNEFKTVKKFGYEEFKARL